ncbi:hypothetical protein ACLPJK_26050 [Pseudomonas aeruginosa]|uniref:hypothetical protein n=1 Tax=Pseudomonas aeruginosa TaxID=287 RepID=UPI003D275EA3
MLSPNNSLPRVIALGIKDDSQELLPYEVESVPVHLPLCPILAPWGPDNQPILTGSGGAQNIFGRKIFDPLYAYYTHQNVLAQEVSAEGNLVYWYRVTGETAQKARLRIAIDYVDEPAVKLYERNTDGTYKLDADGNRIETGETAPGGLARLIIQSIGVVNDVDQFGVGTAAEGTLVNSEGATSTIYPLADFETRFKGKAGDDIGLRIWAPTALSVTPANTDLSYDMGTFLFRFAAISRENENASADVIATRLGEKYVDFSFKSGTIDPETKATYDASDTLLLAYESQVPSEFSGYGPFGRIHVYESNVELVQDKVFATEESFGTILGEITPERTINLLTATSLEGVPYHTLLLDGPAEGGVLFTERTNHWATGGNDGDISIDAFEEGVGKLADSFKSEDNPLSDMLQYPFSFFWDSGFKTAIKEKIPAFLKRRNMYVFLATQVANQPLNDNARESAMAVSLRSLLRAYPEAESFGTSTCRGTPIGNGGIYLRQNYKGNLPFTIGAARRVAAYMGAANGQFTTAAAIDVNPNTIIDDYRNHNVTFKPETARGTDWNNGLMFAQAYDSSRHFWPAWRTVYDKPTSILTSFINVAIACRLTYIAHQAWRTYVGNQLLDDSQYVERVDEFILENAQASFFDNRCTISPRSYYTADDQRRNFSYHTDVGMQGRGMKTVQTLTVIAERQVSTQEA